MGKAAKFLYLLSGRLVPLLDEYSGAAAAYSLRSLTASSTTNVVKVRRSGDDAELDFTADKVSDGTLAAWVGAGGGTEDGFVTTWYDQSGTGNNATQTTAANQPKIVSSGSVILENGKPSIEFDGINDNFIQSNINLLNNKSASSIFAVNKCNSTSVSGLALMEISFTGTGFTRIWIAQGRTIALRYETGGRRVSLDTFSAITSDTDISNQNLISSICNYQNQDLFLYQNTSNVAQDLNFQSSGNTDNTNSDFTIGSTTGLTRFWNGNVQELVFYESDQSANRTGIEANINAHYNIYP